MSDRAPSGAAVGWIAFAGFMMIIAGGLKMLHGLGAILHADSIPGADLLIEQNASTWGWWQLLLGAVVFLAGFAVFKGNVLARTVGVIGAILSVMSMFVVINLYPLSAFTIILIDIAVIWALTVHGRDIQKAQDMGAM
ncbi:MAG TPA: hypothetical protein VIG53_02960 [Actinomycetota bacterium]